MTVSIDERIPAYHVLKRHWNVESETFTGVDSLFAALDRGWRIHETVFYQVQTFGGKRVSHVYHFFLTGPEQTVTMQVIDSPHVQRLIQQQNIKPVPVSQMPQAN